jgi:hypothetical protein
MNNNAMTQKTPKFLVANSSHFQSALNYKLYGDIPSLLQSFEIVSNEQLTF